MALGLSGFGLVAGFPVQALGSDGAVTDIGSRRELFVDEQLIERLTGEARLRLHEPKPEPETFVTDAPWEGSGSGYVNLFQDGDRYRVHPHPARSANSGAALVGSFGGAGAPNSSSAGRHLIILQSKVGALRL
jgi:hypothetical protein